MKQAINNVQNVLIENGWSCKTGPSATGPSATGPSATGPSAYATSPPSLDNKYIYKKTNPYDEFIIEHFSPDEVSITVPIPFRDSAVYYKNTFHLENMNDMHDYIKLHVLNYNNKQ